MDKPTPVVTDVKKSVEHTPIGVNAAAPYPTIPPSMLLYIAWRNLSSRKLRTLLTVFGVTIGIGAIFFLLSFSLGLHNLVTQQVIGNKSIKTIDVESPNTKILKLDNNLSNKIRKLPHVEQVGTAYSFPGSLSYKGGSVDAVAYGVDTNFERLQNLDLVAGRQLVDTDDHQTVVNKVALKTIGIDDTQKAIGQKISLVVPFVDIPTHVSQLNQEFTIVGVVDDNAATEAYVPSGIFQAAGVPSYSYVKLTAQDVADVNGIRSQIESMGYQTSSPVDTLNQINQIFKVFTVLLVGFGGIGMIVSILGMFNTLTISLLERTKEIGLMIVLGGRARDMKRLFTYEAMLLSLIGAALGVALAIILGRLGEGVMNLFAHHRGVTQTFSLFATPWWAILGCILFMVLVGLAVVYLPARRAKHINPIEALRRE